MKRAGMFAVGVLAVTAVAFVALSVISQFASDCTANKISSATSPSGLKVAEQYQIVCQSDVTPRTEIHLIEDGARVSTEIGVSTTNQVGLAWRDEDSLIVTVPPGMDKAFDRTMQGVDMKFQVVSDAALPTPDKTLELTR